MAGVSNIAGPLHANALRAASVTYGLTRDSDQGIIENKSTDKHRDFDPSAAGGRTTEAYAVTR